MIEEPIWVPRSVVDAMHYAQLDEHGGSHGVRDDNAVEAALARPRNKFAYEPESDLAALGAAYAFGLCTSHGFIDGNKRTAFVVCDVFLGLQGYYIEATTDEIETTMLGVASGDVTEQTLSAWIQEHMRERPVSQDPVAAEA